MLARGQRLASEIFKTRLGSFQPGSAGDLLVLDYRPATPLNSATLCHHLLFGMSAAFVQSVMVDGHFVVRDRTVTNVDVRNLFRQTQRGALDLWQRAFGAELPGVGVSLRPAASQEAAPREEGREPARRNEDDLEFEPLVHSSDPGRPWFVCQQPETDPAPDADADFPAATPIPASARKDTPAPASSPKDRTGGGFGAGVL
jgi:hypothetical protein